MKKIILIVIALTCALSAKAQFGALKGMVERGAGNLLGGKLAALVKSEPITTSFKDTDPASVKPPDFGKGATRLNLCKQVFEEGRGYKLAPGFYTAGVKSFCLHAGTYGPSKGDGYLYAPLKGPKEQVIAHIIGNWRTKAPDIDQHTIQALIWAVLAKTNFTNLPVDMAAAAARLLTPKELLFLKGNALDLLSDSDLTRIIGGVPRPVQLVLEAENRLRGLFNTGATSYSALERVAVLAGMAPGGSSVQRGTWTKHPEGFWLCYEPSGYSHTELTVYVPEELGTIYFNPEGDVAVPANTGSQRLAQSAMFFCD